MSQFRPGAAINPIERFIRKAFSDAFIIVVLHSNTVHRMYRASRLLRRRQSLARLEARIRNHQ